MSFIPYEKKEYIYPRAIKALIIFLKNDIQIANYCQKTREELLDYFINSGFFVEGISTELKKPDKNGIFQLHTTDPSQLIFIKKILNTLKYTEGNIRAIEDINLSDDNSATNITAKLVAALYTGINEIVVSIQLLSDSDDTIQSLLYPQLNELSLKLNSGLSILNKFSQKALSSEGNKPLTDIINILPKYEVSNSKSNNIINFIITNIPSWFKQMQDILELSEDKAATSNLKNKQMLLQKTFDNLSQDLGGFSAVKKAPELFVNVLYISKAILSEYINVTQKTHGDASKALNAIKHQYTPNLIIELEVIEENLGLKPGTLVTPILKKAESIYLQVATQVHNTGKANKLMTHYNNPLHTKTQSATTSTISFDPSLTCMQDSIFTNKITEARFNRLAEAKYQFEEYQDFKKSAAIFFDLFEKLFENKTYYQGNIKNLTPYERILFAQAYKKIQSVIAKYDNALDVSLVLGLTLNVTDLFEFIDSLGLNIDDKKLIVSIFHNYQSILIDEINKLTIEDAIKSKLILAANYFENHRDELCNLLTIEIENSLKTKEPEEEIISEFKELYNSGWIYWVDSSVNLLSSGINLTSKSISTAYKLIAPFIWQTEYKKIQNIKKQVLIKIETKIADAKFKQESIIIRKKDIPYQTRVQTEILQENANQNLLPNEIFHEASLFANQIFAIDEHLNILNKLLDELNKHNENEIVTKLPKGNEQLIYSINEVKNNLLGLCNQKNINEYKKIPRVKIKSVIKMIYEVKAELEERKSIYTKNQTNLIEKYRKIKNDNLENEPLKTTPIIEYTTLLKRLKNSDLSKKIANFTKTQFIPYLEKNLSEILVKKLLLNYETPPFDDLYSCPRPIKNYKELFGAFYKIKLMMEKLESLADYEDAYWTVNRTFFLINALSATIGDGLYAYYYLDTFVEEATLKTLIQNGLKIIEPLKTIPFIAENFYLQPNIDQSIVENRNIRPLSKLAADSEGRGDEARRTAVSTPAHEDSSTESTKQFTSAVEFRKKSIDIHQMWEREQAIVYNAKKNITQNIYEKKITSAKPQDKENKASWQEKLEPKLSILFALPEKIKAYEKGEKFDIANIPEDAKQRSKALLELTKSIAISQKGIRNLLALTAELEGALLNVGAVSNQVIIKKLKKLRNTFGKEILIESDNTEFALGMKPGALSTPILTKFDDLYRKLIKTTIDSKAPEYKVLMEDLSLEKARLESEEKRYNYIDNCESESKIIKERCS